MEKYLQAKEDMLSVKQLQADNKQASQCLTRCNKAIKDLYGDKVPAVAKNAPIKMLSTQSNPVADSEKPEEKKAEETPEETAKPAEDQDEEAVSLDDITLSEMTAADMEKRLTEVKDEGNVEFKAKSFLMAGSKFTEGIVLYQKHEKLCKDNKDLMAKVAQLYTNRALAWHSLGNQDDVLKDVAYVLDNIDSENPKALFRRAIAYKTKGQLAKAAKDLETLVRVEPKNPHAKKELIQIKTQLKEESKNAPKIQELDDTPQQPERKEEPSK